MYEKLQQASKRWRRRMLSMLTINEHKPGWRDDDPMDLLRHLYEEVQELERALADMNQHNVGKVVREATDVANLAMMIADVAAAYGRSDDGVDHDKCGNPSHHFMYDFLDGPDSLMRQHRRLLRDRDLSGAKTT